MKLWRQYFMISYDIIKYFYLVEQIEKNKKREYIFISSHHNIYNNNDGDEDDQYQL
jgi:hypothetical protein